MGILQPLGRDRRQAAVGVAQNQHRVGPLLPQHRVGLGDHLADGLRRRLAGGVQEVIGLANLEILEEISLSS